MITIQQISSLEKVRPDSSLDYKEITHSTVLKGERFSYQIATRNDSCESSINDLEIESPLVNYIKVFYVDYAVMDCPITNNGAETDANYITKEPGLMPDILVPLEERNGIWSVGASARSLWIEVNVPANLAPDTTTSADGAFPSGDPFILYPSKDGAYSSIRAKLPHP